MLEVFIIYMAAIGAFEWYWALGPVAYVAYVLVAGKLLLITEQAIVRALERRRVSKKFKDIRKNKEGL
jgi:membrane protein required for beta-lactamase induction